MSKIDINICSCTSDCSELELLATNKRDNTKENLLEVAENPDLLEVKTGVPTSAKTKLFPKRDETKLDKEDFESFTRGFNEFETKHDEEIKVLKREDTVLREKLRDKVNTTDLPNFNSFATKEELSDKVSADSLPDFSNFATNEELNKKANLEKLEEYATKLDLENKANTNDLPDFEMFATKEELKTKLDKGDFVTQLDNKANISDLPNFENFASKEELKTKLDINVFNTHLDKINAGVDYNLVSLSDFNKTELRRGIHYLQLKLKPNTSYIISTNTPRRITNTDNTANLFVYNSNDSSPNSYTNGIDINTSGKVITTNVDGLLILSFRDTQGSNDPDNDIKSFRQRKNWVVISELFKYDKWIPSIEDITTKIYDNQSKSFLDLFVVGENEIPENKTGKLIFVKEV